MELFRLSLRRFWQNLKTNKRKQSPHPYRKRIEYTLTDTDDRCCRCPCFHRKLPDFLRRTVRKHFHLICMPFIFQNDNANITKIKHNDKSREGCFSDTDNTRTLAIFHEHSRSPQQISEKIIFGARFHPIPAQREKPPDTLLCRANG